MKVKDAMRILGCSRATIHNWLKSDALRLARTLPNGYREIDDASVYEATERVYGPSKGEAVVAVFAKDKSCALYSVGGETAKRVQEYLDSLGCERLQPRQAGR